MTANITHTTHCDTHALGWIASHVSWTQPFTREQLVQVRDYFRRTGGLPPCDCSRFTVDQLTTRINTARKAGDPAYDALLAERRRLRKDLREEQDA